MAVYHDRVCRTCGRQFSGGPRSWYCPECREDRRRERNRKYSHKPAKRPIGSTDICKNCGAKYTVCSGLQKYCPDCQEMMHKKLDNKQGTEYYRKKYKNNEENRKKRSKRRRELYPDKKDAINAKRRENHAAKKNPPKE